MISIIIIVIISGIVLHRYKSDYYKGLYATIFFLILMPGNVTINLPGALPALSIHRILIILWFIKWFKNREIDKTIGNIPFAGLFIAIAVSYLFSTFLAEVYIVSIKRYLYFLLESFLFFIMLQTSFTGKTIIQKTINSVIFSLAVVAVLAIIEKKTGFNITPMLGTRDDYFSFNYATRENVGYDMVTATYGHRILMGLALASSLLYNLILINKNNDKSTNRKYLIFMLLAALSLYYSMSRGPWIAFLLGALFALFLNPRDLSKKFAVMGIGSLLMLILNPATWRSISSLVLATFNPDSLKGSSYNWRYLVWNTAVSELKDKGILEFIFGTGGGSHLLLDFRQVISSTGHIHQLISWDMEYAIILFERGVLGFLLVILLYILIFYKGTKHYYLQKNKSKELLIGLSSLITFVFIKTNVSVFIVQCIYLEFISIAIISAIISQRFITDEKASTNKK